MKRNNYILILFLIVLVMNILSCRKDSAITNAATTSKFDTLLPVKSGEIIIWREWDQSSSSEGFHQIRKINDSLYFLTEDGDSCYLIDSIYLTRGSKNIYFSKYRYTNTAYCKMQNDSVVMWGLEMQIWNGKWITTDSLVAEFKSMYYHPLGGPPPGNYTLTPYSGIMRIKIY